MAETPSFTSQIPDKFLEDAGTSEWARDLTLYLNDLNREGGVVSTVGETETIVLTQQEKLDLMTVTASVNLDTVKAASEANTTALAGLQDSAPAYSITNDGTDRAYSADAAAGAITNPPSQAEVENIRDAVLEIADVLATLIRDLKDKDIFG
ncbi:MAG: hypothetical protein KOO63_08235 [Bacteroidales bacterium]|nr:hypothetical protein [Candidatus Latescibacterota bacterium]